MATSNEELGDEDRLPWLETVDEDYDEAPSVLRIVALVLLGLALIAALVYAIYWFQQNHRPAGGNGELIAAQEGDYKVKPNDPGGMKADGEGATAIATSEGAATGDGAIDLSAVPETPIVGKPAAGAAPAGSGSSVATAPVPASGGQLQAKAPVSAPKVASGGASGALVQLGAFPDEASANAAWNGLAKRFGYLAPLGKSVEKADLNGHALYRLRVNAGSAGQAAQLCGKLKVAGEACFVP